MGSAIKCFSPNRRQRSNNKSEILEARKVISPNRPNSSVIVAANPYENGNSPAREVINPLYVLDMKAIKIESEFQPKIVESIFKNETNRRSEEPAKTQESESNQMQYQSKFELNKKTLEQSNVSYEDVPSLVVSKIQMTSDQEVKDLIATEKIMIKENNPLQDKQNSSKGNNIQNLNHFGTENNFGMKIEESAIISETNLSHKESSTNKLDAPESHNKVDNNEQLSQEKGLKNKTIIEFSDEEESNIEESKKEVENSKTETGFLSPISKIDNSNLKIINANEETIGNKVNLLLLKSNNDALHMQANQDELEKKRIENTV